MATQNPRKKKLDAISTKIAIFMFQETFTDELDAQKLLNNAIGLLNQAAAILVKNDDKPSA